MLNREIVRRRRLAEQRAHDIFGLENLGGEEVDGILRVQVEIHPVIPQRLHVGITSGCIIALGVRRAHVGGIFANHVGDGSFVLDHLLLPHVRRD